MHTTMKSVMIQPGPTKTATPWPALLWPQCKREGCCHLHLHEERNFLDTFQTTLVWVSESI